PRPLVASPKCLSIQWRQSRDRWRNDIAALVLVKRRHSSMTNRYRKMRRAFIAITLMGASLYTSAGELADFAVKQAHAKNFTGCDAAIKKTHEFATSGDIRVNVMSFDETPNSLTMTSTWGTKGDSLYGKTVFTKLGK